MRDRPWQSLSESQAGLLSRRQLNDLGIDRNRIRNHVDAERWVEVSSMVVSTTTGTLTRQQLMWLGVLHAGPHSVLGDLTAAEVCGLKNWHRDLITVIVPQKLILDGEPEGIRFVRTRRLIEPMRDPARALPTWRIEPAILHFAAYQPSRRTAQGVIAAAVQQQLTTPDRLVTWLGTMRPLRWASLFRQAIGDIAGGSQSLAEIDILRLCRAQGLRTPDRQTRRRDASGRLRYTDCEWELADGRVLVLEVDGSFHIEVERWEDDIARQRRLGVPGRESQRAL